MSFKEKLKELTSIWYYTKNEIDELLNEIGGGGQYLRFE